MYSVLSINAFLYLFELCFFLSILLIILDSKSEPKNKPLEHDNNFLTPWSIPIILPNSFNLGSSFS